MRNRTIAALLFLFAALSATAQNIGTISGTITDSANAVLPNATVTLTNQRTGDARAVSTNEVGSFVITPLPPATYDLRVEATGFRTYNQSGITLQI
jgi:uncharacterized lipoprotein YajG